MADQIIRKIATTERGKLAEAEDPKAATIAKAASRAAAIRAELAKLSAIADHPDIRIGLPARQKVAELREQLAEVNAEIRKAAGTSVTKRAPAAPPQLSTDVARRMRQAVQKMLKGPIPPSLEAELARLDRVMKGSR